MGRMYLRTQQWSAAAARNLRAWGWGWGGGHALQTARQFEHDNNQAHLPHVKKTSLVTRRPHRHACDTTQDSCCADDGVYSGGYAAAGLRARGEEAGVAHLTLQHFHGEADHSADQGTD